MVYAWIVGGVVAGFLLLVIGLGIGVVWCDPRAYTPPSDKEPPDVY